MAFLAVFQALYRGLAIGGLARSDVPEWARAFSEKWHVHPGLPRCPRGPSLTPPTLPLPRLSANLDLISHLCYPVFCVCRGAALGRGHLAPGPRLVLGPDSGMVRPAGFDHPSADSAALGRAGFPADGGGFTAISRVDPELALASPLGCLGACGGGVDLAGMAAFMAGYPTTRAGLAVRGDVGWADVIGSVASHGMPTRPRSATTVGSDDGPEP